MECSRDSFENLQKEECKAFLHMCLVQVSPDGKNSTTASRGIMQSDGNPESDAQCFLLSAGADGSDFSASSVFMDPPEVTRQRHTLSNWRFANPCAQCNCREECAEVGFVPLELQGSQAEEEWAGVECKVEEIINGTDVEVDVNETDVESAFPAPVPVVPVVFGDDVVGQGRKDQVGGDGSGFLSRLRRMSFEKFPDDEREKNDEIAEYGPEEYVPLGKFPRYISKPSVI